MFSLTNNLPLKYFTFPLDNLYCFSKPLLIIISTSDINWSIYISNKVNVYDIVISGGVTSNKRFREKLSSIDSNNLYRIKFPDIFIFGKTPKNLRILKYSSGLKRVQGGPRAPGRILVQEV